MFGLGSALVDGAALVDGLALVELVELAEELVLGAGGFPGCAGCTVWPPNRETDKLESCCRAPKSCADADTGKIAEAAARHEADKASANFLFINSSWEDEDSFIKHSCKNEKKNEYLKLMLTLSNLKRM